MPYANYKKHIFMFHLFISLVWLFVDVSLDSFYSHHQMLNCESKDTCFYWQ